MEYQTLVTEFLAVAAIILMVASVAVPISVLIAQAAGQRLKPRPGQWRFLLRKISALGRGGRFRWTARAAAMPRPERQRRRAHKRLPTCLMGSLHTKLDTQIDNLCDVVDFSAGGARVRLVDPMAEISRITLGLRHFGFFPARVVWRQGDELGLKFDLAPETVVGQMRGLLSKAALAGAF
jgi:PilZ domain